MAQPALSARVLILLAAAILINYVDRGNLATAGPLLAGELHLTNTQLGILLSAFYWTYAPMQLAAGWLAERFDLGRLLALGLALWSLATFATGLVGTYAAILVLRLVLGLGESAFYPCSSKLLAQRALPDQRARANGLIAAGQALGPTVGTFAGGLLMSRFGWRAVMIGFGLASLAWLWPWLRAMRREPTAPQLATQPVTYLDILKERSLWGASIGQFCTNYMYFFMLSWLPLYLVRVRGFSMSSMSVTVALVYLLYAASCTATGWFADRLVRSGRSPNRVYKTLIVGSAIGSAACTMLCVSMPSHLLTWLFAAGFCFGLGGPMLFLIAQTLAGPRAAGQWVGIQNFSGNLAGIFTGWVTGVIVDTTGTFDAAFALASFIVLAGAVAWGIVIPRIEAVRWKTTGRISATGPCPPDCASP
jgi:MFS family permease